MLDENYFFECSRGANEHTLRFAVDKEENVLYTSVFLCQYRPWYSRIIIAIKYIFGKKCQFGHFDCFELRKEDVQKLTLLLNEITDKN